MTAFSSVKYNVRLHKRLFEINKYHSLLKANKTFILSYLKGTLSDSEMKECDILMDSSSSYFSLEVNEMRKTYHFLDNLEAQKDIETKVAWEKVYRKIKVDKGKRILWNLLRNTAAILLPLLLLHQFVIQPLFNETSEEIITLHSAPGTITKAVLSDGSEVWLNSQSELIYPRIFTGKERVVKLTGEAYFKVVSDKRNRFNVETIDKTIISAYGTEFNVNAYTEDASHIITLTKGSIDVSLDNLSDKQILKYGQKAIVDPHSKTLKVSAADTYVETAWKDGKMVFRRENIKNIADKLARKFGVEIRVEGNVSKDYQFTATFTNESLEDILELLKLSSSIHYTISRQEKLPNETFSNRIVTLICN